MTKSPAARLDRGSPTSGRDSPALRDASRPESPRVESRKPNTKELVKVIADTYVLIEQVRDCYRSERLETLRRRERLRNESGYWIWVPAVTGIGSCFTPIEM